MPLQRKKEKQPYWENAIKNRSNTCSVRCLYEHLTEQILLLTYIKI